jgi:hypothetical protein
LVFVVITTGLLVAQDIILHNSDNTFKETLRTQKRSSEQQLRAYVGLVIASMPVLRPDSPIEIKFRLQNFGLTPARNVRIKHHSYIAAAPSNNLMATISDYSAKDSTPGTTVYPSVPIDPILAGEKFTAEQVQSFMDNKSAIAWYGTIYYEDIFGIERTTNFCRWFALAYNHTTGGPMCHNHREET